MTDDTALRVTRLARYPVKACGAEPLDAAQLGPAGLRWDRVLAVVVGDEIVTQRNHPQLARVRPTLDDAVDDAVGDTGGDLKLRLGGIPQLEEVAGVVTPTGPVRTVRIFGEPVDVVEQAPELSAWFGALLQADARLVMAPERSRRRTPGVRQGLTALSDEATVSLHSQASLDELNARLAVRGHPALPADRFRANLVVDGCGAHAEDRADRIAIGEVVLGFAQLDSRCAVTTVDQQTGRRAGAEPLRTLADYRRDPDGAGGVRFGVYLTVEQPGVVRVGDHVTLAES